MSKTNTLILSDSNNLCGREELNLHPLRDYHLKVACMPFHHVRESFGYTRHLSGMVSGSADNSPPKKIIIKQTQLTLSLLKCAEERSKNLSLRSRTLRSKI